MNIKLGDIEKSLDALKILYQSKGLDSLTAYKIMRNVKKIDEEVSILENEKTRLFNIYCQKDGNGTPIIENGKITIVGENVEMFQREIEKIYNEEVDVTIKKITLDSISKAGLSPLQIASIEFMLEEE